MTEEPLTGFAICNITYEIAWLTKAKKGQPAVFEDGSIEIGSHGYALFFLEALIINLERYGIFSERVHYMKSLLEEMEEKYTGGPAAQLLTQSDAHRLESLGDELLASFRELINQRNFVEATPMGGLLDYRKLQVQGVSGLFRDEEIVKKLPPIVASDMHDAIRCLAFNIPTPAVMIAVRATEGILRHAYASFLGKPPGAAHWKEVSEAVFKEMKSKGLNTADIDGYLSHIRNVRNKAEHPDTCFALKEAEDLLINAQYAMVEVLKFIP
jgi:hypothetical protein